MGKSYDFAINYIQKWHYDQFKKIVITGFVDFNILYDKYNFITIINGLKLTLTIQKL